MNKQLSMLIGIVLILIFGYFFYVQKSTKTTTEIRAYIIDFDATRMALENMGAVFKSEYAFTDYIYQPKDHKVDLNKEFIRLRAYKKTAWKQKNFVIVHKIKETQGLTGKTPLHKEFDSLTEAQQELKGYTLDFYFYRIGWEYTLDNMKIFVEDIQGLQPTIEIVAPTKNEIDTLFKKLPIVTIINNSVPWLIEQQKQPTIF